MAKKKNMLVSDASGVTGQGPLYDEPDQGGGTAVDTSQVATTPDLYDTPETPTPDVRGSNLPPRPEVAPSPGGQVMPPPPQSPLPPSPNIPQGGAPAQQSQLPPLSPEMQALRGQLNQPEPQLPHPSWWRMALGALTPGELSPLVTYGPHGLEQIAKHREWEQNLPRRVQLEDTMARVQGQEREHQEAEAQRQAQLAETQRQHDLEDAHNRAAQAEKQYQESIDFQNPAKTGGRIVAPGGQDLDPALWDTAPNAPWDPAGTKRFVPKTQTVTPEMANTDLAKDMGWKAGDIRTQGEITTFLRAQGSIIGKQKPSPETTDQIRALVNDTVNPNKYTDMNHRVYAGLLDANTRGNTAAFNEILAQARSEVAQNERAEKEQGHIAAREGQTKAINPTTGERKLLPANAPMPPGFIAEGPGGQVMAGQLKDTAKAIQSASDMQEAATSAAGLADMANKGNAEADRALVVQFMGAIKPEGLGKIRLNQAEQNFIVGATGALGSLDRLRERVVSGGVLTTDERKQMVDIMNYMATRAAGHAKERQSGGKGGSAPTPAPAPANVPVKTWNPKTGKFE